ncbi:MAG: NAD(P)/FAD-dependent oxidoreductase [Bacteroidota bacterium]
MIKQLEISLLPEQCNNEETTKFYVGKKSGIDDISGIRILRKSLDARKKTIHFNLLLDVYIQENMPARDLEFDFKDVRNAPHAVIIGAGPAGLFAALQLIEQGIKPVIFERGKAVRERRRDLAQITRFNTVNPESNYCFGEGGAGTYSDGKLYTRSTKRGDVQRILRLLVKHGADEKILYEAHPHIGTNKLPHIITAIRETIEQYGGEVHFNSRLTDITIEKGAIAAVSINSGQTIRTSQLILATGHSARDIFELLHRKQILVEAKPFALGVRIEHPQELIDSIQYKCDVRGEFLPPATYNIVNQSLGHGVFSFCMCPGGIIAPASTAPGEVVVNGWSPSKRNNEFANSGLVVSVDAKDYAAFNEAGPLAALRFQQMVEQRCFAATQSLQAPAQRVADFVNKKTSGTLPACSYLPGLQSHHLDDVLPGFIAASLRDALKTFGQKLRGYVTNDAVMVATESRTSSPVRIPRDKETLEHPQIKGLYPCAEGAGYAGGIVSAAIDGERCANMIIQKNRS